MEWQGDLEEAVLNKLDSWVRALANGPDGAPSVNFRHPTLNFKHLATNRTTAISMCVPSRRVRAGWRLHGFPS